MTADFRRWEWCGGLAWAREIRRQIGVMQCRTVHHKRFELTCAELTPQRIRSRAECPAAAIAEILPLLENARRHGGTIVDRACFGHRTGWTRARLGELLVEARNRAAAIARGCDRYQVDKGPRFDPQRLPDHRLDSLIQRHPSMAVVELLRAERARRVQA